MLKLVVEPKQPSRAKLPMVAGFRSGTRLSTGEGEDVDGVVGETPPGRPLEAAGTEGKDPEGAMEPPGPDGTGMGLFAEVGPGTPLEPPADPEGGGTGLFTGPEAELSAELGDAGGDAIEVGTEPSPCVLGATTDPSDAGAPLDTGELAPPPPSASVELGAGAMAELGCTDSLAGRPDAELDGETGP